MKCLFFTETSECASPAEVFNAYHDGPPGQITFKLGTMLQYKCESGYTLSRDAVVRAWCVGGGAWVGPNMTCSRNYYRINTSFVNTDFFFLPHSPEIEISGESECRAFLKLEEIKAIHHYWVYLLEYRLSYNTNDTSVYIALACIYCLNKLFKYLSERIWKSVLPTVLLNANQSVLHVVLICHETEEVSNKHYDERSVKTFV